MEDSAYMVVACPKCHTKYKIQKSRIPPQGKSGQCKICQTRFTVHLKSQGITSAPSQESGQETVRFCPKCNRRQDYGEVCYLCGSRLVSRVEKRVPNQTDQQQTAPVQKKPQESFISTKTGVEITATFFPLMWILFLTRPTFVIDGQSYRGGWRRRFFKSLPPGGHHIRIHFFYLFFPECGANEMEMEIYKNEICEIRYSFNIPFVFAKGEIRLANVRVHEGSKKSSPNFNRIAPSIPWHRTKGGVIWLMILLFPVGLFLFWDTDHFTLRTKILVTVFFALFFIGRYLSP